MRDDRVEVVTVYMIHLPASALSVVSPCCTEARLLEVSTRPASMGDFWFMLLI